MRAFSRPGLPHRFGFPARRNPDLRRGRAAAKPYRQSSSPAFGATTPGAAERLKTNGTDTASKWSPMALVTCTAKCRWGADEYPVLPESPSL